MFKIAICDDSDIDAGALSTALEKLRARGIDYEEESYTNGLSLIKAYEAGSRYHLIILDMLMEPLNGIDTAKFIRSMDLTVPILIVTSTMEFALDGYQINAWRYLMKPIDPDRLVRVIEEIFEATAERDDEYFVVDNSDGIAKFKLDDILYFDSRLHTMTLHTVQTTYSFRGVMNRIEQDCAAKGFFRIHKSFLVNLRHVQRVSRLKVLLANGEELDLSKRRADAMNEALLDYVSKRRGTLRHPGRGREVS